MAHGKNNFGSGWHERLAALGQIPPVLKIVWQSGPAVVTLGILVRFFSALLPIGLLAVSKLIIDSIVDVVAHHQPISNRFWWLVAAEFALAVLHGAFLDLLDGALHFAGLGRLASPLPGLERQGHRVDRLAWTIQQQARDVPGPAGDHRAGDAASFASLLQQALLQPKSWAEIAETGRIFAQANFAVKTMADAYRALYRQALAAQRR